MTLIWIAVALFFTAIETWIWPKMPLTGPPTAEGVPGLFGVWFGIGVFMSTLWYAFDGIECRALRTGEIVGQLAAGHCHHPHHGGHDVVPATNLDITSGAKEAFNQGGKWFGG